MRRKTFDVLFSTRDGMEMLVKEKCLWRSLWYFAMSVGLFCGVTTNQLFLAQKKKPIFFHPSRYRYVLALLPLYWL